MSLTDGAYGAIFYLSAPKGAFFIDFDFRSSHGETSNGEPRLNWQPLNENLLPALVSFEFPALMPAEGQERLEQGLSNLGTLLRRRR
jgi:hypothetical protein